MHSDSPLRRIIVPGFCNSGIGHWQTLWQLRLGQARRTRPASWSRPQRDDWVAALEQEVQQAPGPVVLIAHSLGCMTVAEWAVGHNTEKVKAAMLVAIPDVERPHRPPQIQGFSTPKLAALPFRSLAVLSSNDPCATLVRGRYFAGKFHCEVHEIGHRGHINHASGLGEWEQGLEWLEELEAA